MNPLRVWAKCLGNDAAADWAALVQSLHARQVTVAEGAEDLGGPGLFLCHGLCDGALAELASHSSRKTGPVIVVAPRRAVLGTGGVWRLLQAGVDDVFIVDESPDPSGALAARLLRIAEIEELIHSALIGEHLVGTSPAWRRVLRQAVECARFSDNSLLITGESGTGKELVARLVHTLDARPDKGKLVVLDCTTVVPGLSGSEFFGHERGAFTNAVAARDGAFALAHNGTLFLDEVGELPVGLQAELLRAVQERSYKRVGSNTWQQTNFRLVCATNRDLKAEEAKGQFRLDFYHRIACSRCHLPPLRERRDDILPLARHFLRQTAREPGDLDFDPTVREFLLTQDYPGNVRELRQLVLRIARRHVGPGPITVGAIPEEDRSSTVQWLRRDWRDAEFRQALRRALAGGADLQEIKDETIEAAIEVALSDAAGSLQAAAARLGVTDRALQLRRAARREVALNAGSRAPTSREPPPSMDKKIRPLPQSSKS